MSLGPAMPLVVMAVVEVILATLQFPVSGHLMPRVPRNLPIASLVFSGSELLLVVQPWTKERLPPPPSSGEVVTRRQRVGMLNTRLGPRP